jgi:hypothetical protein
MNSSSSENSVRVSSVGCPARVDLVASGEHQDRRPVARPAQPAGRLEPVDVRHQHVEHDRVRLDGARVEPVQGFGAVGGELNLVPLECKRAPQRLADRRFVVDDEDLGVHRAHCRRRR